MAKIAELEKQLSQARRELEALRVSRGCRGAEGPRAEGCGGTPLTCWGLSPLQEQLSPPRPPSPPSPQPQECYRLALERRLAELEEKGLVQILRSPDGDVAIEIVPVVIETPAAPVVSGEATATTDTTATCTGTVGARGCPRPGGDTWHKGGVAASLWAQKPRRGCGDVPGDSG